MPGPKITSKRPYLIRAMHEWMSDNTLTPHIVVDANHEGVSVPDDYVTNGRVILNVSHGATRELVLGDERVSFETRFGGVPERVEIPTGAVLGIYARETGQGMIFSDEEPPPPAAKKGERRPARPSLKVVK